jgi:hypothetical protein
MNSERRTQNAERRKNPFLNSAFCVLRSAFLLLTLVAAQAASACPVCYGDPNSPMTKGTSNGIAFLLGTVFFVQLGFVAMFWSFWRRAKALRKRRESMRVIQGGAH